MAPQHVRYEDIPQTMRDALDEVYKPEGVEAWWNTPNRLLHGMSARRAWGSVEGRRLVRDVVDSLSGQVAT